MRATLAPIAAFGISLAACGGARPAERSGDPASGASELSPSEDAVGIGASGQTEWSCDRSGPAVAGDAEPALVRAVEELRSLARDPAALAPRIDRVYWSRWERATALHGPDAPAPGPLAESTEAAGVLASVLAEIPADCTPSWVANELRIDFPPAMDDTPEANAVEIEAVRELAYAGREVSAYCGPCPVVAVLFRVEPDGRHTVLRAADLRFSDEGSNR